MAISDKMQRLTARTDAAVAERKAQIKQAAEHVRADAEPVDASLPRRAISSYSTYEEAERAVDRLADQGFAVRRSAIVGRGLRSVEQVTGRMTPGRAALTGAAEGGLIGLLFALLFGIFFVGPDFASSCCTRSSWGSGWPRRSEPSRSTCTAAGGGLRLGHPHRGGSLRAGGRGGIRRRGDACTRVDAGNALTREGPADRAGEGTPLGAFETSGAGGAPDVSSCREFPEGERNGMRNPRPPAPRPRRHGVARPSGDVTS